MNQVNKWSGFYFPKTFYNRMNTNLIIEYAEYNNINFQVYRRFGIVRTITTFRLVLKKKKKTGHFNDIHLLKY